MRYHVHITRRAELDVDAILAWFLEQGSTVAGAKWLRRLFDAMDTLERMPQRCGIIAEAGELGEELRELLVGKRRGIYRVVFQVRGRSVHILHIRHSAKDRLTAEDL